MKNSKKKVRKNSNYKRSATHYNVLARNKYKHDLGKPVDEWTDTEYGFMLQYIDLIHGNMVFLDRIIRDFDVFNITYGEDGKPVTIELSINDAVLEENKTHFIADIGADGCVFGNDGSVRGGCGLRFGKNRYGGLAVKWEDAIPVCRLHGDRPGSEDEGLFVGTEPSLVMESIVDFYNLKAQYPSIFQ